MLTKRVNFQTDEPKEDRKLAVFVSCVLCLRSVFCVMLGTRTMLGATENMEFINILSLNTIFVILQVT